MTQDELEMDFYDLMGIDVRKWVNDNIHKPIKSDIPGWDTSKPNTFNAIKWELLALTGSIHAQRTESLLSKAGRSLNRLLRRDRD